MLEEQQSIHLAVWPKADTSLLKTVTVTIPVQINGRLRDTITISVDAPEEQVIQKAQESEKIKKYIGGGKYKKTIYVPGKILNIIIS